MPEPPFLMLRRGPLRWPIGHRPVAIGRLPENEVVLGGDKVSRIHAYLVPTPEGPMLVDRSRHGTAVNGEIMRAPWLLAEGDQITIGAAVFTVEAGPPGGLPAASQAVGEGTSRLRRWLSRYGPSEVLGTVAAVGAAVGVEQVTGSTVAAAYAGTLAETVVFYGVMLLKESIREAHEAGSKGRPFSDRDMLPLVRNLVLEFGLAEVLDILVIRPACMGVGLRYIGGNLGALLGKLGADLVFYGPVLAISEWRLARHGARLRADRRRRTTATALPRADS